MNATYGTRKVTRRYGRAAWVITITVPGAGTSRYGSRYYGSLAAAKAAVAELAAQGRP